MPNFQVNYLILGVIEVKVLKTITYHTWYFVHPQMQILIFYKPDTFLSPSWQCQHNKGAILAFYLEKSNNENSSIDIRWLAEMHRGCGRRKQRRTLSEVMWSKSVWKVTSGCDWFSDNQSAFSLHAARLAGRQCNLHDTSTTVHLLTYETGAFSSNTVLILTDLKLFHVDVWQTSSANFIKF